jgi:hypothetical protein
VTAFAPFNFALSDHDGRVRFNSTGDTASHIDDKSDTMVPCIKLDTLKLSPTYIKMDIEGAEPEALWGARETLRRYKPVLAVCAYHADPHLWEIPLLLHLLVPTHDLRLRRYAEGPWELVWYAVPPERVA